MSMIPPEAHSQRPNVSDDSWWYNLKTGDIERGLLSPAIHRVGPFATEMEARGALEIVRARAEAWKKEEEDER